MNGYSHTVRALAVVALCAGTAHAQQFSPPVLLSNSVPAADPWDEYPEVATDGAGTWVVAWGSRDSVGGSGPDSDIVFVRSTDNGVSWTPLAVLNTNAASDSQDDYNVHVVTDRAGNWIATWTSDENLDGTIGEDPDIAVARSSDNGATWTAPASLATDAAAPGDHHDFWVQVTTDGAGHWVAIWTSYQGGFLYHDIAVARSSDNGATWTAPTAINTAEDLGEDSNPQLATDGAGNWVATWSARNGLAETLGFDFDILVARSTDNGATWTTPAALNTDAAVDSRSDERPQIATDGNGHWVATWDTHEGATDYEVMFARSSDNGATWTAPAELKTTAGTDAGDDIDSEVTTDGNGNWLATWSANEGPGTDYDLLTARSSDNGATWSAAAALTTNFTSDAGDDWTARVATDGAGHWMVTWYFSDETQKANTGQPFRVDVYVALGGICGDGTPALPETCDDGNQVAGDCCSATCEVEAAGNACAPDAVACTIDVCDGNGGCGVADDSLCDDAMACTVDSCDVEAGCQHSNEPLADSLCLAAGRTKLQVSDSTDAERDKLSWQWTNGAGFDQNDLGTPLAATGYTLCVYDMNASAPSLATSLDVPASATQWTDRSPKGLVYKDAGGAADGVRSVLLKTGVDRNKVKLSARGSALSLPGAVGAGYFHQSPSVIVQLHNDAGTCWTSSFAVDDTSANEAGSFKATTR